MVIGLLVLVLSSIGFCDITNPYVGNWTGSVAFEIAPSEGYQNYRIMYLKTESNGKSEGALISKETQDSEGTILKIEGTCTSEGFSYILTNARNVPTFSIEGKLSQATEKISGTFHWKACVSDIMNGQGRITLVKD